MADDKALDKRVAQLEASLRQTQELLRQTQGLLRSAGMPFPSEVSGDPTQRPDYVEPGSDRYLAFLGLVRVEPDSLDEVQFVTREGQDGTKYRLVDPVGPYVGYADPGQAARIALLQKVAVFEAGEPPVHDKAYELWVPKDVKPELARTMRGR
jgi:hypothetical protein